MIVGSTVQPDLIYSPAFPILVRDLVASLAGVRLHVVGSEAGPGVRFEGESPAIRIVGRDDTRQMLLSRPLSATDRPAEPGLVREPVGGSRADRFVAVNLSPVTETVEPPTIIRSEPPTERVQALLRAYPTETVLTVAELHPYFALPVLLLLGLAAWLRLRRLR
jgi:hypothetical protein